ncbi:hypothetical protein F2Q69_00059736 [Brassica cretica]|uniref:Uncharacterized protein n=1 Tax=Brassica cretica TaxID=69181 RepID=A0A8S9RCF3_BRACR|nr:hypothetical protein F2Q69_00059736 [Brassica cretica]
MSSQGDHAIDRSNEPAERDLEGSSVQERGDVSGIESTEDASEPTTAPVALSPAPVAVNHADGTGLDPEDLVVLSDYTSGEDGGDKSNEQNPPDLKTDGTGGASNPLGAQVIGEDLDRAED